MFESSLLCILAIVYSPLLVQGEEDTNVVAVSTCRRKLVPVNSKLNASEACLEFCPNDTHKDLNDESICAYELTTAGRFSSAWVLRSGHCVNGTCLEPGEESREHAVNISCLAPPREVFEQEFLVRNCTYECYGTGKRQTSPDGTSCVLKRKRVENFVTGYRAPTEAGICKNGSCVQDTSQKCKPQNIDATKSVQVVRNCTVQCPNGTRVRLSDGLQCALSTSRRWYAFWTVYATRTGICENGTCVPYLNQTPTDDPQCSGQKVAVNDEVTLAVGCQVQCKNGTTVNRPDGTLCLFEYKLLKHGWLNSLESYGLGRCKNGVCVSGEHPYVITVNAKPKYKYK